MFSTRGIRATPGYSLFLLPWAGTKANTLFATRTQSSAEFGGGRLDTDSTAVSDLFSQDEWLDTGTYKAALIHRTGPDRGIYNVTGISGTQTVDGYAGVAADNAYTEVTGIAVTAGLKTVQVSMATKNASSSAYGGSLQSLAFLRTGA